MSDNDINEKMSILAIPSLVPGFWAAAFFYHKFFPDNPQVWYTVPVILTGLLVLFVAWFTSALVGLYFWEKLDD